MIRVTRRTFIKRSGTATLGSVLGLGLLPSLTRKLHATDQSEPTISKSSNGVKFKFEKASLTQSWDVKGGKLSISINLSSSPEQGVCALTGVMSVLRVASFVITHSRVAYLGKVTDLSLVTWQSQDGVPRPVYVAHPTPPSTAPVVAIANPDRPAETIGTLFTTGSASTDTAVSMTATVYIGDEYSNDYTLGPLPYSVSPCPV
jgi:hypothetical protein